MKHSTTLEPRKRETAEQAMDHLLTKHWNLPKLITDTAESTMLSNAGLGIRLEFDGKKLLTRTFYSIMKKHVEFKPVVCKVDLVEGVYLVQIQSAPHPFFINEEIGWPMDTFSTEEDTAQIQNNKRCRMALRWDLYTLGLADTEGIK